MKMHNQVGKTAVLFTLACVLTACGSYRINSTLAPSGNTDLTLGPVQFNLAHSTVAHDEDDAGAAYAAKTLTPELLQQRAKVLYPKLFTDDWTALPVRPTTTIRSGGDGPLMRAAIFTALTAGIIPFPGKQTTDYTVNADVRGPAGDSLASGHTSFQYEQVTWASLIGPLGCIPVPGKAEDRGTMFLFIPVAGPSYSEAEAMYGQYMADRIVEAIVQQLRSIDPALIGEAHKARKARLKEVVIDGRKVWSFLAPVISNDSGEAISFTVLFYTDYPSRNSTPLEQVEVARRDASGAWVSQTAYLRSTASLTSVKAVMDKGIPVAISIQKVTEPPIQDFINLPDAYTAADIRWSNNVLIEAKNSSLLDLMRYGSRAELTSLVTRIEKEILSLTEKAQMADSKVQQIVINNGDPSAENEMAVLHRQRITVLEAILSALKRASAR